jgi:hypothetical protein
VRCPQAIGDGGEAVSPVQTCASGRQTRKRSARAWQEKDTTRADHNHDSDYAERNHSHDYDYADRYHTHNDNDRIVRGLREDLGHAEERIYTLENQLADVLQRLAALEGGKIRA